MNEAEKIANRAFEIYLERQRMNPKNFWLHYAYGYLSGCNNYGAARCHEIVTAIFQAEILFAKLCEELVQ